MHPLKTHFQTGDKFAGHCGMELVSLAAGHAVTRMTLQPWHLNAVGVAQGGAIFTLADFAFGAAANTHGAVALGVNVSITYLKAAKAGIVTAEAREVARNPKLSLPRFDGQRENPKKGLLHDRPEEDRGNAPAVRASVQTRSGAPVAKQWTSC